MRNRETKAEIQRHTQTKPEKRQYWPRHVGERIDLNGELLFINQRGMLKKKDLLSTIKSIKKDKTSFKCLNYMRLCRTNAAHWRSCPLYHTVVMHAPEPLSIFCCPHWPVDLCCSTQPLYPLKVLERLLRLLFFAI